MNKQNLVGLIMKPLCETILIKKGKFSLNSIFPSFLRRISIKTNNFEVNVPVHTRRCFDIRTTSFITLWMLYGCRNDVVCLLGLVLFDFWTFI